MKNVICIFLFLCLKIYAMRTEYVALVVNDFKYNGFYTLYLVEDKIFLDLDEFLYFIGAVNVEIKNNRLVGDYDFKNIDIDLKKLKKQGLILEKNKIFYISLDGLRRLKSIKTVIYNDENLKLKVYFRNKLIEQKKNQEENARKKIESENKTKLLNYKDGKTYISLEEVERLPEVKKVIYNDKNSYLKIEMEGALRGNQEVKTYELLNYKDGKTYISLSDLSKLYKKVKPRNKSQEPFEEREENLKDENYIDKESWKFFTPGMLGIRYSNADFKNNNSSLSLNFDNQLFYGHLNLQYYLKREHDKYEGDFQNINWERNVSDDRRVVVGDVYQTTKGNISGESMRGVTISRNGEWDYSSRVTKNSISGIAPNGTTVELYKNGVLIGYKNIIDGNYTFIIDKKNSDNYVLRYYYPDGTRKKVDINTLNDYGLITKDAVDYELQLGEGEDKEKIYTAMIYYGLFENTTVGVGGQSLRDKKENTNNIFFMNSITSDDFLGSPYKLEANFMEDQLSNSGYTVDFNQKIGRASYGFYYENYNDFSNYIDYEKKLELSLGGNVNGYGYGVSYNQEVLKEIEESNYEISLNKGYGDLYLDLTYRDYGEENSYRIGSSYFIGRTSFFRGLVDSVGFNYEKFNGQDNSNVYEMYIVKNRMMGNGLSYQLSYRKEKENEEVIRLEIAYQFGNIFEIGSSTNNSGSSGGYINTGINFSKDSLIDYDSSAGKSTIRGKVFIDENANGGFDKEERGLEGVIIETDGGKKGKTNVMGEYIITGVSSNVKRNLKVLGENMDIYYAIPNDKRIQALPGGVFDIDIPIIQMQTISGVVRFTDNFYYEEVMEILTNSTIIAENRLTRKKYTVKLTDENYILDLPSGEYKINLLYDGEEKIIIDSLGSYYVDIKNIKDLDGLFFIKLSKNNENTYSLEVLSENNSMKDRIKYHENIEVINTNKIVQREVK